MIKVKTYQQPKRRHLLGSRLQLSRHSVHEPMQIFLVALSWVLLAYVGRLELAVLLWYSQNLVCKL